MLDLVHLRSFVMVATELHFGRAAQRLNMTQPPLSRQVQLLEAEIGAPLFVRANRAVRLTAAGHALLPEARSLLQRTEAAAQIARRAASTPGGEVTVGFIGASTYGFLPRLVSRARAELPDVELQFRELSSVEQHEALLLNRIDIGLARPVPEHAGIGSDCVQREGLALALPLDHPLAVRRRPVLRQIDGEPFIMYSQEGRYLHDLIRGAFLASRVQPRLVQHMSHAQAILSLVSTGMGLAIVPEEARNACFDNVVFRPISLGAGIAVELHAVWRTEDCAPALSAVRDLIRRIGDKR
ncbi:MAG TPA: LysR family transcriptional regulator [Stellaceae bacterium]|nr:LysR family transcriptional regulator [Stellaceae bacterium]